MQDGQWHREARKCHGATPIGCRGVLRFPFNVFCLPSMTLPPHRLKIVLVAPQIAPNPGNIARLCVATSPALHLVRPLGFVLSDKMIRRSEMDYWPRLKLTLHDDLEAFLRVAGDDAGRVWMFSTKGE